MGIAGPKGKKKGTATVAKKVPKRARPSGAKKAPKKAKPSAERTDATPSDPMEEDGTEGESDNGPYCICRGPDDHRWMIFCERCEDWFHGECINLDKGIGESLIEKFICPNCTSGKLTTLYKKTCAMGACRKPARLSSGEQSVFCSDEHAQMWWERMVSRLPKGKGKTGLNDQLTQGEFMALLSSGMANVDKDGLLKLAKIPFQGDLPKMPNGDGKGMFRPHVTLPLGIVLFLGGGVVSLY
jgi:COMPASS component SPP1